MAGAMADGPRTLVGPGIVVQGRRPDADLVSGSYRAHEVLDHPLHGLAGFVGHKRVHRHRTSRHQASPPECAGGCTGLHSSAAGKADGMVLEACVGGSASSATAQTSIPSATSTQRVTLTTRCAHIPGVLLASHATETVETGSPPPPCITSTRAAAARRLGGFL